jgi:hypothetical protein
VRERGSLEEKRKKRTESAMELASNKGQPSEKEFSAQQNGIIV